MSLHLHTLFFDSPQGTKQYGYLVSSGCLFSNKLGWHVQSVAAVQNSGILWIWNGSQE